MADGKHNLGGKHMKIIHKSNILHIISEDDEDKEIMNKLNKAISSTSGCMLVVLDKELAFDMLEDYLYVTK